MSNYSKLYWLTRLDYLQGFFIGFAILTGVIVVIHFIVLGVFEGDANVLKTWQKYLLSTLCSVFILLACLTPTRNEAVFIMAGGKTMDYVQSDTSLSKMPYQATKLISDYLDRQIKENNKK